MKENKTKTKKRKNEGNSERKEQRKKERKKERRNIFVFACKCLSDAVCHCVRARQGVQAAECAYVTRVFELFF